MEQVEQLNSGSYTVFAHPACVFNAGESDHLRIHCKALSEEMLSKYMYSQNCFVPHKLQTCYIFQFYFNELSNRSVFRQSRLLLISMTAGPQCML